MAAWLHGEGINLPEELRDSISYPGKEPNYNAVNHHYAMREMNNGTKEAFTHILQVILENDLLRYPSIASPMCYHLGLTYNPTQEWGEWRTRWNKDEYKKLSPDLLKQCCSTAYDCLTNKTAKEKNLKSKELSSAYLGLWSLAQTSLEDAADAALAMAQSTSMPQSMAALYASQQFQNTPTAARCVSMVLKNPKKRKDATITAMAMLTCGTGFLRPGFERVLFGPELTLLGRYPVAKLEPMDVVLAPAVNNPGGQFSHEELRQFYEKMYFGRVG